MDPSTTASANDALAERADEVLVACYGDGRISLVRGEGCRVWDADGRQYLDLLAGIAVNCLGHAHPAMRAALSEQASRLIHCSNKFVIEQQVELASWLCARTFAEKVFFTSTGTEAMEAAVKLARRVAWCRQMPERVELVAFEGSFHGRTYASMSLTGQAKYREGYAPLVPGVEHVPFQDAAALDAAVTDATAAVVLEPIQGEGGVRPFDDAFLRDLRALCSERGALLVFDEIQTGVGRTGRLFACEHAGVAPDIMVVAKALGGGFPIGALLTTTDLAACFTTGSHGTTFGGNPLACAVGLAVCRTLEAEKLLDHVERMGSHFQAGLRRLQERYPQVNDVRGRGLMIGLGLVNGAKAVERGMRDRGVIVNAIGEHTIRIVPPLIIAASEIDEALAAFDAVLSQQACPSEQAGLSEGAGRQG